jgi:hypothetical protein
MHQWCLPNHTPFDVNTGGIIPLDIFRECVDKGKDESKQGGGEERREERREERGKNREESFYLLSSLTLRSACSSPAACYTRIHLPLFHSPPLSSVAMGRKKGRGRGRGGQSSSASPPLGSSSSLTEGAEGYPTVRPTPAKLKK